MKKRVRVYKAGGQSDQPTQEQILSYVSQRMSSDDFDGDTDSLKAELSQAGIPDETAEQYINYVSENLGLDEEGQGDEEAQLAAEEQARAQEEEQALYEQQLAEEEAAQKAQQEAMYNVEVNPEDTEDTEEIADDDEDSYMREGGTRLSKKSFIKQYTKFAKMAQGGDTPSPGADDVLNGREAHVKGFLGAVKNTANEAMLREEAENQYNSAYGAPQVGAFQDGGINQEEVDFENPLHHLSTYGADTRHIFSDNMYTENDVAAMEQYGGNTGQGLYRFMGGGDNESADEMYQDADIDFNQEEYQMGGFRMPKRSGRQYTQAVGSPYYTATGQAAVNPNLAGRQVTSVDVTKRGIFGRPKAYTVNYGNPNSTTSNITPQIKMPTEDQAKILDAKAKTSTSPTGEYMPPNEFTGKRQPIANWMMRTGIPGVRGLGAKMIESKQLPEYDVQVNDPEEIRRVQKRMPNYKSFDETNNEYAANSEQANVAKAIEDFKSQSRTMREFGGPIDYTEYAYGGDVSIPELHKYQMDGQVAFNPNDNNMNISNLQGFFDKAPTKDVTGQPIQATVPESMQPKNITIDPNQPNNKTVTDQPDNLSQDYESKKNWDKTRKNFALGMTGINAGLDIFDQVTANRQQNQMLEDITSAESNYGISNQDDRGDYDPNSGLFRPDQTGFKGVAGYGGVYANGGSTEEDDEDVQYMTQEEIDDFIANGGELEYL